MNIKKIRELNAEIESFNSCYDGNDLWGGQELPVSSEKLIEFMIEHPYLQEIANKIAKLEKGLNP
jgi:hypothetical protein